MAIAVDQANLGTAINDTGATSIAVTTTGAVAPSGFVVVGCLGFLAGISVTSVTGGGLTWTIDKQGHAGSPAAPNTAIISAQAPAGLAGGTTITVNFSATSQVHAVGVSSFTGVATSAPVDITSGPLGVAPAATGWTTPSTFIQAESLLVGCCGQETANTTSTPTSPSLELYDVTHVNGFGLTAAYRIQGSSGSYTVAGTFATNVQSNTVAVAYLAAVATPPAPDGVYRPVRMKGPSRA